MNKSSIDFLLSDSKDEDELIKVVPCTFSAISKHKKKRTIRRPKNPRLSLEIIQQPKNAKVSSRAAGRVFLPFSEHRPIHPPPVLQLKIDDFRPKHEGVLSDSLVDTLRANQGAKYAERLQELGVIKKMRENRVPPWVHYSTFFVTARLRCAQDQSEKLLFHNQHSKSVDDLLIGTNVASGMPLSLKINSAISNKQLNHLIPPEKVKANNYGIVFVFPDLSVRKVGTFKLKFDLFEVYNGNVYWRNDVYSDDIQVFTPKKFPGSIPSSPLTSFLYRRGARIRQRKRTPSKRAHDEDEGDDDQAYSESPPMREENVSKAEHVGSHASEYMGDSRSHSTAATSTNSASASYAQTVHRYHPPPVPAHYEQHQQQQYHQHHQQQLYAPLPPPPLTRPHYIVYQPQGYPSHTHYQQPHHIPPQHSPTIMYPAPMAYQSYQMSPPPQPPHVGVYPYQPMMPLQPQIPSQQHQQRQNLEQRHQYPSLQNEDKQHDNK